MNRALENALERIGLSHRAADPGAPDYTPEQRMLFALVCDAIECSLGLHGVVRCGQAREWFAGRYATDYGVSAEYVLVAVGIDPQAARRALALQWSGDLVTRARHLRNGGRGVSANRMRKEREPRPPRGSIPVKPLVWADVVKSDYAVGWYGGRRAA